MLLESELIQLLGKSHRTYARCVLKYRRGINFSLYKTATCSLVLTLSVVIVLSKYLLMLDVA